MQWRYFQATSTQHQHTYLPSGQPACFYVSLEGVGNILRTAGLHDLLDLEEVLPPDG